MTMCMLEGRVLLIERKTARITQLGGAKLSTDTRQVFLMKLEGGGSRAIDVCSQS